MSAMLHEMAKVIADEFGAVAQVDGEDDSRFIVDMFYLAAEPAENVP